MKATRLRSIPKHLAQSIRDRLAARSRTLPDGCVIWTGSLDRYGYGRFKVTMPGRAVHTGAHRAAWLAGRGSIEGDLVIDHLCRNRACVNLDHLELVTNRVNTERGNLTGRPRITADQHACGKHGRDDGYLSQRKDGYYYWACRPCRNARVRRWRAARAAAVATPASNGTDAMPCDV